MQSGSERRALRRRRQSGHHPQTARWADHRHAAMTLHHRRNLGQVDLVMFADRFAEQRRQQTNSTDGALIRIVVHGLIEVLAQPPAVTFVTRLGTARPRLVALRLAIRRRRPGRRTRRLDRQLQPQHQLDQLSLAQTLKIVPAHTILN